MKSFEESDEETLSRGVEAEGDVEETFAQSLEADAQAERDFMRSLEDPGICLTQFMHSALYCDNLDLARAIHAELSQRHSRQEHRTAIGVWSAGRRQGVEPDNCDLHHQAEGERDQIDTSDFYLED